MAGERLEVANLGWYGFTGDRRLAFRRIDNRIGMPWLTAGKLPDLVLFAPQRCEDGAQGDLPTHVRTPDGAELPVFGEKLAAEVGRRYGAPVEMMHLRHGIFDEACVSVIASDTVSEIGRLAGRSLDIRRFRPNIVVQLLRSGSFSEDEWVGGELSFGEGDDAPAVNVTMRDERCAMVNIDPDSASIATEVMKAVVRRTRTTRESTARSRAPVNWRSDRPYFFVRLPRRPCKESIVYSRRRRKMQFPFPVLVDPDMHVHTSVGASGAQAVPAAALYITDRFLEVFAVWRTGAGDRLPDISEVLSWLTYLDSQYPECTQIEWPTDD
jgi:uncharacterized protein YcbX